MDAAFISTVRTIAITVQIAALLGAAWSDLRSRIIPNGVCLALAIAGAVARLTLGPVALVVSAGAAALLFLILAVLPRGVLGGGDIKLLAAAALGQSPVDLTRLVAITALAGGMLAVLHLALRRLPCPARPRAGAPLLRRVYAVERWRILRHAPLPYGIAIACGCTWTMLAGIGG